MTTPRAAVGNAADRKQVKSAGTKGKLAERQRAADVRAVMATVEGRRENWRMLRDCGVTESVMRGGPEMTSFFAGKQDVGHELLARLLKYAPDAYLLMQREAIDEERRDAPLEEEEEPDEVKAEEVDES
jgi:hypothetical protein